MHLVIGWKLKCWDDVIEAGYRFTNGTTEMYGVIIMVVMFLILFKLLV
ncbi:MAG: hypothetical protein KA264_11230 [Crocinitomicaceae bacterium]|nr:hypothetical protein [Crocinitomicaceae bacterium]